MKKYLVLLPNNLGDVIMALPVLEALKKKEQNHITFFVEDGFEGGALSCAYYDELFLFPRKKIKKGILSPEWQQSIDEIRSIVNRIRESQFDTILNLCQHSYVAVLMGFLNPESVIGRRFLKDGCHAVPDMWSRYLYAIPFARSLNRLHATDTYKYISGVDRCDTRGTIYMTREELRSASEFLTADGWSSEKKTILIHPGAAYLSKMWPVENYIILIKKLVAQGMWVIITGSESERDIAIGIKEQVGRNCTVTSGLFTFRASLAFADIAEFCITGDTAMMHAASALSKKVFALFGPTNPVETGPYGSGHMIFAGRCSSRPCFCFECKTRMCMRSISPECVFTMITSGHTGTYSCDIYRTAFSSDATYSLIPVVEQGSSYFDSARSLFVRNVFDSSGENAVIPKSCAKEIELECTHLIECIKSMENALVAYIESNEMQHIKMFEKLRGEAAHVKGIAEFFTAVLNIGLNGIPLLNLVRSVQESIHTCKQLGVMLTEAKDAMRTM